ncbi:Helix-turn-helix [Mycobacteroides abscessus subsp. bolletii]|uniref:helix-turn-helix domain-containing protein n=1 Tax=Mycobacteroides abscessus TaxID=36809 RepID=UPI0009A6C379|nr:helix-turn-helix transcriptional regulator [Mycobacteroides abscessus]SLD50578.1 Helix-turn-helix [Mycobacteroides abscessus subsp. bolletii]
MQSNPTPKTAAVVAASGLDKSEIAARMHISTTTLNRRLKGGTPFKAGELIALANVLGVKPSELL